MRKTHLFLCSILLIVFITACGAEDSKEDQQVEEKDTLNSESEQQIYEDTVRIMTEELEKKDINDVKFSEKDYWDFQDNNNQYKVSGDLFKKDGSTLGTFDMQLEYIEDDIHYESKWDIPENDTSNSDLTEDQEGNSTLNTLNRLANHSTQTEEIYITGDLVIGETEEVTPGIYDLEIIGGSGNIQGKRSNPSPLHINWVGGPKGNSAGHPSKIRIILLEGDTLGFRDISKVKFNAVPEKVEPSNELGIGEFIVGRDISPGDYKLSTNAKLNPEYENLGWDITIYNNKNGESHDQKLTATNNDVLVSLKDGEIISISYDNTDHGSSSDDAKLIFTKN